MTSKVFKIPCKKVELRLDITLQCGQSFRWHEISPGKWRGVIGKHLWTLFQDDSFISYENHNHLETVRNNRKEILQKSTRDLTEFPLKPKRLKTKHPAAKKACNIIDDIDHSKYVSDKEKHEALLTDYFQLNFPLEQMYATWSKADTNFATVCQRFPGVRMLNQDPVENVFSFICSSNNNIKRIAGLVEKLCTLYGSPLAIVDGTTWYSFPSVSSLALEGVEDTLRNHGFGYRAKFIHKSAQMILERGGESWLHSLRSLPYPECHSQLTSLTGIGAKVSDCICLMSMGHLNAIPVDTHVFQIAVRDYLPHLSSCKTVTNRVYKEIADHFRGVFGEYAGWAHSVLFSADLRKFDEFKSQESKETSKNVRKKSKEGKKKSKNA